MNKYKGPWDASGYRQRSTSTVKLRAMSASVIGEDVNNFRWFDGEGWKDVPRLDAQHDCACERCGYQFCACCDECEYPPRDCNCAETLREKEASSCENAKLDAELRAMPQKPRLTEDTWPMPNEHLPKLDPQRSPFDPNAPLATDRIDRVRIAQLCELFKQALQQKYSGIYVEVAYRPEKGDWTIECVRGKQRWLSGIDETTMVGLAAIEPALSRWFELIDKSLRDAIAADPNQLTNQELAGRGVRWQDRIGEAAIFTRCTAFAELHQLVFGWDRCSGQLRFEVPTRSHPTAASPGRGCDGWYSVLDETALLPHPDPREMLNYWFYRTEQELLRLGYRVSGPMLQRPENWPPRSFAEAMSRSRLPNA